MTRSRALLLLWLAAAMLGAGALALLVPGGPGEEAPARRGWMRGCATRRASRPGTGWRFPA